MYLLNPNATKIHTFFMGTDKVRLLLIGSQLVVVLCCRQEDLSVRAFLLVVDRSPDAQFTSTSINNIAYIFIGISTRTNHKDYRPRPHVIP
jgi:hypothetical protein